MFCPDCGSKIPLEAAKFCPKCGFDLSKLRQPALTLTAEVVDSQPKPPPEPAQTPEVAAPQPAIQTETSTPPQQASTDLSFDLSAVELNLPQKKGWGWYILAGIFFTQTDKYYKDYGKLGEVSLDGIMSLLGLALVLPLYFWLRNRFLLNRIKTHITRSFVSGIVAWFLVGFLIAAVADFKIRADAKQLAGDMKLMLVDLSPRLDSFKKSDADLWLPYAPEPTTTNEIQTNIHVIRTALPLYKTHFEDSAKAFRTMQSCVQGKLTECPALDRVYNGHYSQLAGQLETVAVKVDHLGQLNQAMLANLLDYNQSLARSEPEATTYLRNAQSAKTKVDSATREYQSLFSDIWGQPPKQ